MRRILWLLVGAGIVTATFASAPGLAGSVTAEIPPTIGPPVLPGLSGVLLTDARSPVANMNALNWFTLGYVIGSLLG